MWQNFLLGQITDTQDITGTVLEEREVMPVGSTSVIPIDVRVICATNRNLNEMVRQGTFREDLYYRLMVLNLEIPPLREHPEDIVPCAEHFFGTFGEKKPPFEKNAQRKCETTFDGILLARKYS